MQTIQTNHIKTIDNIFQNNTKQYQTIKRTQTIHTYRINTVYNIYKDNAEQ